MDRGTKKITKKIKETGMFKDLKKKTARVYEEDLTVAQENKLVDLFAEGKTYVEIKHAMREDFDSGKAYHHLIKPAIAKIKSVEDECFSIMSSNSAPDTITNLKKAIRNNHPEYSKTATEYLVGKIVAATGTFTEYKSCFEPGD